MTINTTKYVSGKDHTPSLVEKYASTFGLPYRYLAYREFSNSLSIYKNINRVLDFGCGTGASTQFLIEKNYDVVIGTDKSESMLKKAKSTFPKITFANLLELNKENPFDLVFSSFVLFELSNKTEIINYLNQAASLLRPGGVFYGVTGSEYLHKKNNHWTSFDVNYHENIEPQSGNIVKLKLKGSDLEFEDYFWTKKDYAECFNKSDLKLVKTFYPLGHENEPYCWENEIDLPIFVVFIAEKKSPLTSIF